MTRSSVSIALVCLVALLSRSSVSGFTISLAPLLAASRIGLGPWGSNYVNNFSSPASSSSSEVKTQKKAIVGGATEKKPAVQNFKFEYDDIRMLSGCKSECLELIYAKSMDRGFASA